jgi:hypothetical protein
MGGYDIGGGYEGWRTATPWDDEVAMTVSFECRKCEHYNDDVDAIGSRGSDEVIVYCYECDAENSVDVGRDE